MRLDNIDTQYKELHERILEESVSLQANRTDTATHAVFGASIMLDLKKSFPSVTLSKTFNRGAFVELVWIYMRGDTNVKFLNDHGVNFWNQWAIEEDVITTVPITLDMQFAIAEAKGVDLSGCDKSVPFALECALRDNDIPEEMEIVEHHKGDLGPVYGAMARKFPAVEFTENGAEIVYVDQIGRLIEDLKNNPKSRRHLVSLWQPGLLPDENYTPQENVLKGKQALAPCHWGFVIMTRELTLEERYVTATHPNFQYDPVDHRDDPRLKDVDYAEVTQHAMLDELGVPRYEANLHLLMRSSDVPAGLRLNIVCYAALLHALCGECGMSVGKLWYTGTNAHIYDNQVDAVNEYCANEPSDEQIRLWVNPDKSFFDLEPEDFKVEGYVSNKRVPVPVAV